MGPPVEEEQEEPELMDVDDDAPEVQEDPGESVNTKKSGTKKDATTLDREPGKSLLPHARVQKIIKADKDIPIVAKEATFLISLATEEFIRRISEASAKAAKRENRSTVQGRDLASVVRRVDEFLFLEDIMPFITAEPKRTSKVKQIMSEVSSLKAAPTFMDQFVSKPGQQQPDQEKDSESPLAAANSGESDG
ncbi:histone-fold-containing protein [Coprinopsis sp. MPI-PUGE-AT-0042]|nr:histone-fold-containing protein [Coprinopsis sp. MPI-PUGE-AT-0042]